MEQNLTDVAAERAVLAAIFQYGKEAYLECFDSINAQSFSQHLNSVIYSILMYLYGQDMDVVVDLAKLMSGAKEIGLLNEIENDIKYINTLFNFNVELTNIRGFSIKLRKLQETKELLCCIDSTASAIREITGNETISEIVAIAEKPIYDFTNRLMGGAQQVEQVGVGLDEYLENIRDQKIVGIDIGCPIYQEAIGGLEMGVHVIGARKKTGKSFKALNAAIYNAGKNRLPTLLLDTELQKENGQWIRMLARVSEINQDLIKHGKFYEDERMLQKIERAANVLKSIPLDYLNVAGRQFDEIISIVRRWLMQKVGYDNHGKLNKCLVVYDYLKITASNDIKAVTEWQQLGFRMGSLHDICVQYNFPILTFVQLNREHEIAASDRISWYCTSYASFSSKTPEEIAEDGPQNGNRKLVIEDARFGEGLDGGDYINFAFNGGISRIKELTTRNRIHKDRA
jgi:replicative DNA helicase